jgi:hypothetical protein
LRLPARREERPKVRGISPAGGEALQASGAQPESPLISWPDHLPSGNQKRFWRVNRPRIDHRGVNSDCIGRTDFFRISHLPSQASMSEGRSCVCIDSGFRGRMPPCFVRDFLCPSMITLQRSRQGKTKKRSGVPESIGATCTRTQTKSGYRSFRSQLTFCC